MRTGLSAGTLAVLIMWAPEPWGSPGSSSCKNESYCHFTQHHPLNTQNPLDVRGKSKLPLYSYFKDTSIY